MDYEGKPSNSETSSEENDQPAEKFTGDDAGVGRFYECIFCKRGFTNAQALGGHMNIHRKDKAKAKQKSRKPSVASKSNDQEVMSSRNYEGFSYNYEQTQYYNYGVPVESQMNNCQYFLPGSNPNFSRGFDHLGDLSGPRKEYVGLYGVDHDHDYEGLNLSMHIDQYHHESMSKSCRGNTWEEEDDQLDLELRLG